MAFTRDGKKAGPEAVLVYALMNSELVCTEIHLLHKMTDLSNFAKRAKI